MFVCYRRCVSEHFVIAALMLYNSQAAGEWLHFTDSHPNPSLFLSLLLSSPCTKLIPTSCLQNTCCWFDKAELIVVNAELDLVRCTWVKQEQTSISLLGKLILWDCSTTLNLIYSFLRTNEEINNGRCVMENNSYLLLFHGQKSVTILINDFFNFFCTGEVNFVS